LHDLANWDDYRFFASLVQSGSVRASADQLGVNPSTVTRRLDGLESRLGRKLFVRGHAGLQLTPDGDALRARLEPLAAGLGDLDAQVAGADGELAGTVRITLPDVMAITLMAEFAAYSERHPQVRLEFIPGYRRMDLSRGEADVAIQVTDHPPEELVGRQLGYSRLGVYGSRRYLASHDPIDDPEGAIWIDSSVESERAPLFRHRYFDRVPLGVRCSSVLLQQAAVVADMGITLLPCALGDTDERLARVGDLEPLEAQPIWLLFPPELRGVARIRSVSEHIQAAFLRLEPQLLGQLYADDQGA
jgi:DNA-binding transcriptional LysR family regulator